MASPSLSDIILYPVSSSPKDRYPVGSTGSPTLNGIGGNDRFKIPTKSPPTQFGSELEDVKFRKFSLLPNLDECGLPDIDSSLRIIGGKNSEHAGYPEKCSIFSEHCKKGRKKLPHTVLYRLPLDGKDWLSK